MEFIYGQIKENMKECGKIIKCMGKEFLNDLMVVNILVSTLRIKKKEKGCLNGRMEVNILDNGLAENNMEKVYLLLILGRENMGNGRMALGRDGLYLVRTQILKKLKDNSNQ